MTNSVPEENVEQSEEDKKIYNREVIRLELTLQTAEKMREEGDKVICILHYPPCNFHKQDSEFTALLEKYNVDAVVYGHLHGYKRASRKFIKNNIPYYLTSCDMVENKLVEIEI